MKFETNCEKYKPDLEDEIRLFYPLEKFETIDNITINHKMIIENNIVKNISSIVINDKKFENVSENKLIEKSEIERTKFLKRWAKNSMYDALTNATGKSMAWGSLTGIRPTRIAYDLLEKGTERYLLKETLSKEFRLSEEKADLVSRIIKNQKCIIKNDNLVDIYINIPFCPSRCSYCSFLSAEYSAIEKKIPDYILALKSEIREMKKIIISKSLVVRSIYMGGGTPSVLSAENLDEILSELSYPVNEITVECGRPETITRAKLDTLKKNGVTRICINPQTFNEKTLKKIGRKHTVSDVIDAYKLALEYGFDVNMDLIAGLPGEKFANFKKSIDTALELSPANITVHTLALKHGSVLKEQVEIEKDEKDVIKMIDYAISKLEADEYEPYYLYRQKGMISNLENIGFAKKNKVCFFNVDSMEETCSILACGANAISKRVYHLENRIERSANVKFLPDYLERIDEMIARKNNLFKN